jgi:hypothetical protein
MQHWQKTNLCVLIPYGHKYHKPIGSRQDAVSVFRDVTVAWFFHQRGGYENRVHSSFSLQSLGKKKRLAIGCCIKQWCRKELFCFNCPHILINMIDQQWEIYQFINTFLICGSLVELQWRVKGANFKSFLLKFVLFITRVTWLILPVVICLSQRLSHACLSINKFICETANGSLYQL